MPALNAALPVLPTAVQSQPTAQDAANPSSNAADSTPFASVLKAKQVQGDAATSSKDAPATPAADAKDKDESASNGPADATAAVLAVLASAAPAATAEAPAPITAATTTAGVGVTVDDAAAQAHDKKVAQSSTTTDGLAATLMGTHIAAAAQTQQDASQNQGKPSNGSDDPAPAGNGRQPAALLTANVAGGETSKAMGVATEAEHTVSAVKTAETPATNFEAMLANAQANASANRASASAAGNEQRPQLQVDNAVGSNAWPNEVGDKLTWMVGHQNSRAELVLTPPQLGRIEVSINITGNHADASFASTNPEVRTALENAVPRLREVLADVGISLGQTHIGSNSSHQMPQNPKNGDNSGSGRSNPTGSSIGSLDNDLRSANIWSRQGNGLVDTFA